MMDADTFVILQQALRARGMTYADLADALGISEPTVKRIFASRDCKFSRLLDICDVLEVALSDVVDRAARSGDTPLTLPQATEQALADNPSLFHLFILLRDLVSESHIKRRYGLSEAQLFRLGMQLERLGLVEMRPGGRIRLLLQGPIRFRPDGALANHIAHLNMRFLGHVIRHPDQDGATFKTISRRMRPDSGAQIEQALADVVAKITELARQDQLLFADEELTTFKFTCGWAPISYPDILEIKADPTDAAIRTSKLPAMG